MDINDQGNTVLHRAAMDGNKDQVEGLLANGENINAINHQGDTALHLAAAAGHLDVVKVLLVKGAVNNADDFIGNTELTLAAECPDVLDADAYCQTKNKFGATPLHAAARAGHSNVVGVLLKAGADKGATDHYGMTPIHNAASESRLQVAMVLLKAGVDKDSPNEKNGNTPIHYASINNHLDMVEMLIKAGANTNLRNKKGYTPSDYAVIKGYQTIIKALEAADARRDFERNIKSLWNEDQ